MNGLAMAGSLAQFANVLRLSAMALLLDGELFVYFVYPTACCTVFSFFDADIRER